MGADGMAILEQIRAKLTIVSLSEQETAPSCIAMAPRLYLVPLVPVP